MIPEKAKVNIEELIALLYKLTNRVHELEEQLRLKKAPTKQKEGREIRA